jgi:hypothetical protein
MNIGALFDQAIAAIRGGRDVLDCEAITRSDHAERGGYKRIAVVISHPLVAQISAKTLAPRVRP